MGQDRNWTQAEYEQLAEEWGLYSIGAIARHLRRSENAIKIKAVKLGLGRHTESSGRISYNQFFKALGLTGSYSYKLKTYTDNGLKIHNHKVHNCSVRMVDIDEFWEWAEKNKTLIDFARVEPNIFGKEPDWVKIKRAEDFKRQFAIKPNNTPWSEAEDKELLRLLREYKYTWPELSERLHRTEGAIQRRVTDLHIKERPIKADNHTKWTESELLTVCDMIKSGSNYENISRTIGKSVKAIRGRVYTEYLTENLNKVRQIIGSGNWSDNRPPRTLKQKQYMSSSEKEQTKAEASKLVGLLTYRIKKHFEDQDNWQRLLCQNWDKVKGCTVGGVNCDDCEKFERIRPQYCVMCGATFFERTENKRCERCRTQRKKAAARKHLREQSKRK